MKDIDVWIPLNIATRGSGMVYTNPEDLGYTQIKDYYKTTISAPPKKVAITKEQLNKALHKTGVSVKFMNEVAEELGLE